MELEPGPLLVLQTWAHLCAFFVTLAVLGCKFREFLRTGSCKIQIPYVACRALYSITSATPPAPFPIPFPRSSIHLFPEHAKFMLSQDCHTCCSLYLWCPFPHTHIAYSFLPSGLCSNITVSQWHVEVLGRQLYPGSLSQRAGTETREGSWDGPQAWGRADWKDGDEPKL